MTYRTAIDERLQAVAEQIAPADPAYRAEAQRLLDNKTKPLGSLGRLEMLAADLCAMQRRIPPLTEKKRVVVFAADHGVVEEGVSIYPQEVTVQMVANFAQGGAAINVLARQAGADVEIVDVGVKGDTAAMALNHKAMNGTANFARENAMTDVSLNHALMGGSLRAGAAHQEGVNLLALGEMGIGNTTSAAALLCLLTDTPPEHAVGRGTGATDEVLATKLSVVTDAVTRHRRPDLPAWEALRAVGGLEIAALTGAMLGAASLRMPVIIDGFICTVAALAAARIAPSSRDYMIFAHCSAENGSRRVLEALEALPLFDLGMRLGEGSGAAIALHLVEASGRILREMASFEQAGVSTAQGEA